MSIPDATTALEESLRQKRPRTQPKAHNRAMTAVMTSISRAVAAGLTSTVVDVPTFVFGEPRFLVDDVTEYVRMDLEPRGYSVHTFPGVPSVAIAWGNASRNRQQLDGMPNQPEAQETLHRYDVGL